MKNNKIIWILLPVMAMAVACGGGKEDAKEDEKEENKEEAKEVPIKKAGELKMAYIDLDTINANYKLVKLRTDEFAIEQEKINREFKNFEQSIISQQNKIAKDMEILPLSDQKAAQEKYYKLAESLQVKEQELMGKLQEKQAEMIGQMTTRISEKLSEIAKREGYDLILKNSSQMQLFYMDPKFDITKQVLQELNADFEKANPGK